MGLFLLETARDYVVILLVRQAPYGLFFQLILAELDNEEHFVCFKDERIENRALRFKQMLPFGSTSYGLSQEQSKGDQHRTQKKDN